MEYRGFAITQLGPLGFSAMPAESVGGDEDRWPMIHASMGDARSWVDEEVSMTLEALTAAMKRADRVHAPGSESTEWGGYVEDCHTVLGCMPWDDPERIVPEEFATHWLEVADR